MNISRLKSTHRSPRNTGTSDLSPVVNHRERGVVRDGDEGHEGGDKLSRRLASQRDSRVNDPRIERPNKENTERPFTRQNT